MLARNIRRTKPPESERQQLSRDPEGYYTLQGAARYLGVSDVCLDGMVKRGLGPVCTKGPHQINGRYWWRFTEEALDEWRDRQPYIKANPYLEGPKARRDLGPMGITQALYHALRAYQKRMAKYRRNQVSYTGIVREILADFFTNNRDFAHKPSQTAPQESLEHAEERTEAAQDSAIRDVCGTMHIPDKFVSILAELDDQPRSRKRGRTGLTKEEEEVQQKGTRRGWYVKKGSRP